MLGIRWCYTVPTHSFGGFKFWAVWLVLDGNNTGQYNEKIIYHEKTGIAHVYEAEHML